MKDFVIFFQVCRPWHQVCFWHYVGSCISSVPSGWQVLSLWTFHGHGPVTGRFLFLTGKKLLFWTILYNFILFWTIIYWVGTLSKMRDNFKILAKALPWPILSMIIKLVCLKMNKHQKKYNIKIEWCDENQTNCRNRASWKWHLKEIRHNNWKSCKFNKRFEDATLNNSKKQISLVICLSTILQ